MFTGTETLRQNCEADDAYKSFSLIFGERTVDITAVTYDQFKVLMEGFSALCFILQGGRLPVALPVGLPVAVEEDDDDDDDKEEEEDSTDSSTGKDYDFHYVNDDDDDDDDDDGLREVV